MRALPDAPTTQLLRDVASTHPRAVLAHPFFARLAKKDATAFAEIRAIAETETIRRAIFRGLTALDERGRRLVVCDCTEQTLPTIQRFSAYAYDPALPVRAMTVARRYALGEASVRALAAADNAAWDDWSRVCDVAMDAPWNASLTAIRAPTVALASAALRQLAWFTAQEAARGAPTAIWSMRWEEAYRLAHRSQASILAQRRPG